MSNRNPSIAVLKEIVARHDWWYHTMELGHGVRTPGHYGENLLPVARLMRAIEFDGLKCLDLGTMDGKMSFLLEKFSRAREGNGSVLAVDLLRRDTIAELIEAFSSTVVYKPNVHERDLDSLIRTEGHFDFCLFAGLLHHVYSPFDTILGVRRAVKNGGLVVFESACLSSESSPILRLNQGDLYPDHTTIWLPSATALHRMMNFACFDILGECSLGNSGEDIIRHALLCRAVKPSDLAQRIEDEWIRTILSGAAPGKTLEYLLPQLDLALLESFPEVEIRFREALPKQDLLRVGVDTNCLKEFQFLSRGTPSGD